MGEYGPACVFLGHENAVFDKACQIELGLV